MPDRIAAERAPPSQCFGPRSFALIRGRVRLDCRNYNASAAHWGSYSFPAWPTPSPNNCATPTNASPAIQAAAAAAQALRLCDWEPRSWDTLIGHNRPGPQHRGWQQPAAKATHQACRAEVYSHLPPASQALLDSQSGPYASRAFTRIPYTAESTYSSERFRLLMLRRLRVPLPLSTRTCRCRRTLDTLGDHRSACALLRSRSGPLE